MHGALEELFALAEVLVVSVSALGFIGRGERFDDGDDLVFWEGTDSEVVFSDGFWHREGEDMWFGEGGGWGLGELGLWLFGADSDVGSDGSLGGGMFHIDSLFHYRRIARENPRR